MEEVEFDSYVTDEELNELRILLFGDSKKIFSNNWIQHGFYFKGFPPYGLVQKKAGPCGVLAAVQSFVIKELLFGEFRIVLEDGHLRPSFNEKKTALIEAIAEIIWNARSGTTAFVVNKCIETTPKTAFDLPSREENLKIRSFSSFDPFRHYIKLNITMFMYKGGIVLFMYSLILTRSVNVIRDDMDFQETHLIGNANDSYASQEVINLILTGQAVSNVFNGNVQLEELVLKGIQHQSEIGFLSRLDSEVGSFYMDPKYPIWVIHCTIHYLVVFGLSKNVLKTEEPFNLLFIDSFSRNDEILLTIYPFGVENANTFEEIENLPQSIICIQSRWPSSSILVDIIYKT